MLEETNQVSKLQRCIIVTKYDISKKIKVVCVHRLRAKKGVNWDWSWALDRINYWLSKIKSIIDQWLLETSRSSQVICVLCRCMHEMNFYRCNLQ